MSRRGGGLHQLGGSGSAFDDDEITVGSRDSQSTAISHSTVTTKLPQLMVEKRQRGRVTGVQGVRSTFSMNQVALLGLLKTKRERLDMMERISLASEHSNIEPYLKPEPPLVLNNEFGGPSEWKIRKNNVLGRSGQSDKRWISRFEQRMQSLDIIEPRPKKDDVIAEKIAKSGWVNCPINQRDLQVPKFEPNRNIDQVLQSLPMDNEGMFHQSFCAKCWQGISTAPDSRLCCNHCLTVIHTKCVDVSQRYRKDQYTCAFCYDDFYHGLDVQQIRYQKEMDAYQRLKACIKLQAFARLVAKRLRFLRIESALKTVQRAIRQRLYYANRAKAVREAKRPIRIRIHDIILYGDIENLEDQEEAAQGGDLTLGPLEWPRSSLVTELGSIPSAYYESKFGWSCAASNNTKSIGDAVDVVEGGDSSNSSLQVLRILQDRHRTAPQYVENPLPSLRLSKGDVMLIVTLNESPNREQTFPTDGFKIMKDRRLVRPKKIGEHERKKSKQLARFDIPLEYAGIDKHGGRGHCYTVRDGREYLLFPYVTAMIDITWSIVRVKDWPKCEMLGQTFSNLQSLQKRKFSIVFVSNFCSESSTWVFPQVGDECSKMGFSTVNKSGCFIAPGADIGQSLSAGALTWSAISHTEEGQNSAGNFYFFSGPSIHSSAKKKMWCVLIDRIFFIFVPGQSMCRPKKVFDMKICQVGGISGEDASGMIRIKATSETLFILPSLIRESKSWLKKLQGI